MRTLDVRPKKIMLKEGEHIQLEIYAIGDGTEEKIHPKDITFQIQEKSGFDCGYIDQDGVLHAKDSGTHCFYVGVNYKDIDNNMLAGYYTVLKYPEESESESEKTIKDINSDPPSDPPIQRKQVTMTRLSRVTPEQLLDKARRDRKKISAFSHTRAVYRTLAENKDLIWLFFLCSFAIAFGGCILLIINGLSVERIGALLSILLGFLVSLFGKIYTPPGEISESITDRLLGNSEEEKIKKLQTKIEKITQKKNKNQSFYRYTIDENSEE